MKFKTIVMGVVAASVLGAAGYGLYATGMQRGMGMAAAPEASVAANGADKTDGTPPMSIAQGEEATRRISRLASRPGTLTP